MSNENLGKPGVKNDHNKPEMSLITSDFGRALLAVGTVATFGAKKYSAHGWLNVPNGFERYTSAVTRHLLAESINPGGIDPDSQLEDIVMTAWNALARLELHLRVKENTENIPSK